MDSENVVLNGVTMPRAAAQVAEQAGVDPRVDIEQLRGQVTPAELLAACLDGVESPEMISAWRAYVSAVCLAAGEQISEEAVLISDRRCGALS